MALSLLFGQKKRMIGEVQLDAVLSEVHTYENEVTSYPVEDGSTITDHVRKLPDAVEISGFVTNTPISMLDQKTEVVKNLDGTVSVKNLKRTEVVNNVENAYDALLRISGRKVGGEDEAARVVDVVTGLRVYSGMMMTSLRIPRDATTGQTLRFDAKLVKVKTVKSETVLIPAAADSVKNRSASTVYKGNQTPPKADEKTEIEVSKVKALFNLGRSFVGQ